jgi:enamine deaminase RidA (YjgF/YER057c/UK114 family)
MSPSHVPVVPAGHEQFYADWNIAPAVRVGDTLWCSGVIGTRPDGSVPEDLEDELEQAFDNLAHVLQAAGADLGDVADLLTFHLDLAEHVPVFMKVRDRRLTEPWPAWTAIGAAQLGGGLPGVRVEIKATAVVAGGAS